jgi:threonine dehydratase
MRVQFMVKPTSSSFRPSLIDFRAAADRIRGVAFRTPLLPLRRYREEDSGILLKAEVLQPIGSYKIRGVYNWASKLAPEDRRKGLSTLSAGNMAQAVAYTANLYGVRARVAIMAGAPQSKIDACKRYGAEVVIVPAEEAVAYMDNPPPDVTFLHGLEEYTLIEGHGTIGLEIVEDAPDVDTIFVGVGAGFLSCGIALAAKALKPSIRVIGVESETHPLNYRSLRAGKPVDVGHDPTLADGLGAPGISQGKIKLLREALDDTVLVSEKEITEAIRYLATENKLVCEGAAATSLAAAWKTPKAKRGKTVCVLSGGSLEPSKLAEILVK